MSAKITLNLTEEVALGDGDYTLSEGRVWLSVGKYSLRIKESGDGLVVDVYHQGLESDDPFDSLEVHSCENCENGWEGRCPRCFDATGNGCPHGDVCPDCKAEED